MTVKELTAIKDQIMKQEPGERRFIISSLARAVEDAEKQEQTDDRPPWDEGPAAAPLASVAGMNDPGSIEAAETSDELLKVSLHRTFDLLNKRGKVALFNAAVRLLDQQQESQDEG